MSVNGFRYIAEFKIYFHILELFDRLITFIKSLQINVTPF